MAVDYTISFTDTQNGSFIVRSYTTNGPSTPTNGSVLYPAATSANTTLVVVGRGDFDYGQPVQQNMVNLTENFANVSLPTRTIQGQLWYQNRADVTGANPSTITTDSGQLWIRRNQSAMQLGNNPVTDTPVWDQVIVAGNANAVVRGTVTFGNVSGVTITGIPTPLNNTDVASKTYVDSSITGTLGNYVLKSGDTMTGLLILSADPTVALGAATKQYVDTGDATLTASIATKVSIAGNTMTGPLILAADPSVALGAATKQYVDATVSGINSFVMLNGGNTPMTGPLLLNGPPVLSAQAATKNYVDTRSLSSLTDVIITAVTVGQILTWDGSTWVNANNTGGGGGGGSVINGSLDPSTGILTLVTTSGNVSIPNIAPFVDLPTDNISWNADPNITASAVREIALANSNYPNMDLSDQLAITDQLLFAAGKTGRAIANGNGITSAFATEFPFRVGSNKTQVYVNGIKQYCDFFGSASMSVQQRAYNIISVVPASKQWILSGGDHTGDFTVSEIVIITNNSSLDAAGGPDQTKYTVASVTFNGLAQTTTVTVNETVIPTATGTGKLNKAFAGGTCSSATPTGLAYNTNYVFNIAVNGGSTTLIVINIAPTTIPAPAINFNLLNSTINASVLGNAVASFNNSGAVSTNGPRLYSNLTGTGSTVVISNPGSGTYLYTAMLNGNPTPTFTSNAIAATYAYNESGTFGSISSSVIFNTPPGASDVIEIISQLELSTFEGF